MVEFTINDFKILLVMTLTVVLISFVFPAMGFTSSDINATDIPDFNASQNQFDFVGESPELPGNPQEGTMEWIEGAKEEQDNRDIWLSKDEFGISTFNATTAGPYLQPQVNFVNHTDSGGVIMSEYINESEYVYFENWSYALSFENVEIADDNQSYTVDWEVIEQPDNQGFIESIPIVGGIYSAGAELGGGLVWIGQILFHVIALAIQTVTNAFIALFNVLTFMFGFMYWLLSTYTAVVAAAPEAWVAIFLVIPGVILSFEFGKIVILLVRTILQGIPLT